MSILNSLFGNRHDPAKAAMPYLNQVSGVGQQYYNPFIQQGQRAGGIAQGQYDQLAQDPMAFINEIMAGYSPSTGYQFKKDQLSKGLGASAAAGGFRGTSGDQMAQGDLINSLLGQDMQQWLQNVVGAQGIGLQGQENAINRGYDASSSLADYLGTNLGNQAGLAAGSAQFKNNKRAGMFGTLENLLMQAAGAAGQSGAFGKMFGAGAGGGPAVAGSIPATRMNLNTPFLGR